MTKNAVNLPNIIRSQQEKRLKYSVFCFSGNCCKNLKKIQIMVLTKFLLGVILIFAVEKDIRVGQLKSYRKLQKIVDNLNAIMVFYESCFDWQQ